MIHVCYALRDESGTYSKFVGTSIQSLLENTKSEITVHILHDDTLSAENRRKLCEIIYMHDQSVKFYNVNLLASEDFERCLEMPHLNGNRHGIAIFYRLLIPKLFSDEIDRLIYLDADLIINLDIKTMWDIDLKDYSLGAIPEFESGHRESVIQTFAPCKDGDVSPRDYFNAGVLLLDLNKIRNSGRGNNLDFFERSIQVLLEHLDYQMTDQDALNFMYRNNFLKLSPDFNIRVDIERRYRQTDQLRPGIIHYNGRTTKCNLNDVFNQLWFKHYCKTPFFSSESLFNMMKRSQKYTLNVNELWKRIMHLSTNRRRGFFVYPDDAERVVDFIGKSDDDIGINATFPDSLDLLISTMQEHRGKIIFFIKLAASDYRLVRDTLHSLNFKERIDFFNVNELDPNALGYKIVLEM